MIKYNFNQDGLQVTIPNKLEIDLDALNLIFSGSEQELCTASYSEKNGKHILTYYASENESLLSQMARFDLENFLTLLRELLAIVKIADSYSLALNNFKFQINYIFCSDSRYQFVYIPLREKKNISINKTLFALLNSIKIKNEGVGKFILKLKKASSDSEVIDLCKSFISEYTHECTGYDMETSLLSQDETTLLSSVPEVTDNNEAEAETSLVNPEYELSVSSKNFIHTSDNYDQTTEYYQNEFSECETTLFSAPPAVEMADDNPDDFQQRVVPLILIRNRTGERVLVSGNIFLIGKDSENMDYAINNNNISRHHATITYESGIYYIMDNKSTNGTAIEGVPLQPFEKAELSDGSIISLGNESFQIRLGRGE